jgi:hypothetical protein
MFEKNLLYIEDYVLKIPFGALVLVLVIDLLIVVDITVDGIN